MRQVLVDDSVDDVGGCVHLPGRQQRHGPLGELAGVRDPRVGCREVLPRGPSAVIAHELRFIDDRLTDAAHASMCLSLRST